MNGDPRHAADAAEVLSRQRPDGQPARRALEDVPPLLDERQPDAAAYQRPRLSLTQPVQEEKADQAIDDGVCGSAEQTVHRH
jgi:hypothetical protein